MFDVTHEKHCNTKKEESNPATQMDTQYIIKIYENLIS